MIVVVVVVVTGNNGRRAKTGFFVVVVTASGGKARCTLGRLGVKAGFVVVVVVVVLVTVECTVLLGVANLSNTKVDNESLVTPKEFHKNLKLRQVFLILKIFTVYLYSTKYSSMCGFFYSLHLEKERERFYHPNSHSHLHIGVVLQKVSVTMG